MKLLNNLKYIIALVLCLSILFTDHYTSKAIEFYAADINELKYLELCRSQIRDYHPGMQYIEIAYVWQELPERDHLYFYTLPCENKNDVCAFIDQGILCILDKNCCDFSQHFNKLERDNNSYYDKVDEYEPYYSSYGSRWWFGDDYGYKSVTMLDHFDINYLVTCDIRIASSPEACLAYLFNGSSDGIDYNPDFLDFEYNEQIGFEEFDFEIFASNSVDNYFVRFDYKPTQFMRENCGTCTVNWQWTIDSTVFTQFDTPHWFVSSFELDLNKSTEYVYLYDLFLDSNPSLTDKFFKKALIGKEGILDFDDFAVTLGPINLNAGSIYRISSSDFWFQFQPMCQGVNGDLIDVHFDTFNPEISTCNFLKPVLNDDGSFIPVTDDEGNKTVLYEPDPDLFRKKQGYYYTDVSQDNYGNNTYNYYYIDDHGISTEIKNDGSGDPTDKGDVLNVRHQFGSLNVNLTGSIGGIGQGSGSGSATTEQKIIIEDDDYKGNTLLNNVKNLYGYKDDLDTAEKDDGVLSYEKALFQAMPDDIDGMLGYTIGTLCVASILGYVIFRK